MLLSDDCLHQSVRHETSRGALPLSLLRNTRQAKKMNVALANTEKPSGREGMEISDIFFLMSRAGFRPNIDKDGDLCFEWEGRIYYILIQTDDPTFIRVATINVATALGSFEVAQKYCRMINDDCKVVKAICKINDNLPFVWIATETRHRNSNEFFYHLMDYLKEIRACVNYYHEIVEKRFIKDELNGTSSIQRRVLN